MSTHSKSRPELKQFGELCVADFTRHPIWVSCHTADYDEEWYDETDEETFRPWTGILPVGFDEMYLVRSSFILKDGTKMTGFATPASHEREWGIMQPQIFLPTERFVGVWCGMFPRQGATAKFCGALGKNPEEIFPICFSADAGLTSGVCSGEILGLMKSGKSSFEILND